MDEYTPKVWHVFLFSQLCVIFVIIAGFASEKATVGLLVGAGFMALAALVSIWNIKREQDNRDLNVKRDFAETFSKLDPESRAVLGFKFPDSVAYHLTRGQVKKLFEDTDVPVEVWQRFLKDSNDRYISPLRNWYTADMPERHWWTIKQWLVDKGCIVEDSAAGNHSFLWKGNNYKRLFIQWVGVDRELIDMSELERQYAYTEPLPHLNQAPEDV